MSIIILFCYLLFVFPTLASTGDTYIKLIVNSRAVQGNGDGTPAISSLINSGDGTLWVDTSGNLFISDQSNRKIRKVSAVSGIISTFGGTGNLGTGRESGPILSANFKNPVSVVGDSAGRFMYLSDQQFIWRYNISSGIISTIAGTATPGISGDNGLPSNAQMNTPRGLWLTTENDLYIADSLNFRIRKISPTGIITTVVGTAVQDSTGDGGPAAAATLIEPYAVYVDTLGIMFIADSGAKKVRKVDPYFGDMITTFAGTGTSLAYNGDGFPAIYANIGPKDVRGDTLGNIYIVDSGNCRIRKVDMNGIISTFIGTGVCALSLLLTPLTTPVDTATPKGLWIDSQANFYIVESSVVVRRTINSGSSLPTIAPTAITPANTFLQSVAGNGLVGFTGDGGLAISAQISPTSIWVESSSGTIYLTNSNRLRKIDGTTGIITTIGGTSASAATGVSGPIISTSFFNLYSIVGDNQGNNLYLCDQKFIWQYSFSSGIVSVIAGIPGSPGGIGDNGPSSAAQLSTPMGIWLSIYNDLYIADSANHRIRRITAGIITTVVGTTEGNSGDGGAALSAQLRSPLTGCLDSVGKMYIVDSGNARIRMVNTNNIISTFAGNGISGTIYLGDNIPAPQAALAVAKDVKVDKLGNVYIAGNNYKRIVVVNPAGILTTYIGTGLVGISQGLAPLRSNINAPLALWVDYLDNLYFADTTTIRKTAKSVSNAPSPIPVVAPANVFQKRIAGGYTSGYSGDDDQAKTALMNPSRFFVTPTGSIYVPDNNNLVIRKISTSGIITTIGGSAGSSSTAGLPNTITAVSFNIPFAIVCNAAGTTYYISDMQYVWKYIFTSGATSVFAGTSTQGYNSDGIPATSAQLYTPSGLWLTTGDDLYLADYKNHHIRKVVSGIIYTVAGSATGGTFTGDFGSALSATLNFPIAVYVNTLGVVYIADYGNSRIRLVDTVGIITTFCGTPVPGYNGNNIQAGFASLFQPNDIKGDSLGNIFIADSGNCLIRVVNTAGIISNVIGSGGVCAVTKEISSATSSIDAPVALWIDSQGTLYFNSNYNSIHRTTVITPTSMPSSQPSGEPSRQPSSQPSQQPTRQPISAPTSQPSRKPSAQPSCHPSRQPTSRPSAQPSSHPSCQPSCRPSSQPTQQPTRAPSGQPSSRPTTQPSSHPSGQPSRVPSGQPTARPSCQPTSHPSGQPTRQPIGSPSAQPSLQPTSQPSTRPSCQPTRVPSGQPTARPSGQPSSRPSSQPTGHPSVRPSKQPTIRPSGQPTSHPSCQPSSRPSSQPTRQPTRTPSGQPSSRPTTQPSSRSTRLPTGAPSGQPSSTPSYQPISTPSSRPTRQPTLRPSMQPSSRPSSPPSSHPSSKPTDAPSCHPSSRPSKQPSSHPTTNPSVHPTSLPTCIPSSPPTLFPSNMPSRRPSSGPSCEPSISPSSQPTDQPSTRPSSRPTVHPTDFPTATPSDRPSVQPYSLPTTQPTVSPSYLPSTIPTSQPTRIPTLLPSSRPSNNPSVQPTNEPTARPIALPVAFPSTIPSAQPSTQLSSSPSLIPTSHLTSTSSSTTPTPTATNLPSQLPTCQPTVFPTATSSMNPLIPTSIPSLVTTSQPTEVPSSGFPLHPTLVLTQPTPCPSAVPTLQSSAAETSGPSRPIPQPSSQPSTKQTPQPSSSSLPSVLPTSSPIWGPSSQPSSQPTSRPSFLQTMSRAPTPAPTFTPTILSSITGKPTPSPSCKPTVVPSVFNGNSSRFSVIGKNFTSFLFLFGTMQLPVNPTVVGENIDLTSHNILNGQETYIIFGQRKKFQKNVDLGSAESLSVSSRIAPRLIQDTKSRASSIVGDVNGDGFNDIIIGYPSSSLCRVYLGTVNGLMNLLISITIHGEAQTDFGFAVAAGRNDFNRDNYSDMVISSKVSGVIYVFFGRPLLPRDMYVATMTSNDGFKIIGNSNLFNFGFSIANVGDFNRDGYHDVVVSGTTLYGENVISVILGSSSLGDVHLGNPMKNNFFTIYASRFTFAGLSLAGLGDINNDGFDDIAIGSIPYQGNYITQRTYIIYGREVKRQNESLSLSTMREGIDGIMITGGGFMVARPGDVNGDGINDIMIVNYPNWQGQSNSYLLSFPEEPISVPPTILPSSPPSSQPSSSPSAGPTVSTSTTTPTNRPQAAITSSPLSLGATHPPNTIKPTAAPKQTAAPKSFRPSRTPTTISPSRLPSAIPTHSPSELPTLRILESSKPTTLRPSSTVVPTQISSASPTNHSVPDSHFVFNGSFAVVVCLEGGDYVGTDSNEVFQLIGGAPYYHITARPTNSTRMNRKIIALKPAKNRIVIEGFNKENDIIDLTAYSDIFGIGDISFQETPLRLLPFTGQIVQFSGSSSFMFTESNFYFHVPTRPASASQTPKSLLLTMIPLIIVFLCMACFCFPVIIGNTADEKELITGNMTETDVQNIEASIKSSIGDSGGPNILFSDSFVEADLESGIRSKSGVSESSIGDEDDEESDSSSLNEYLENHGPEYFTDDLSIRGASDVILEKDEQEEMVEENDEEKSSSSESSETSSNSSSGWDSIDEEEDNFSEIEFV
jgi:hypothetical protein